MHVEPVAELDKVCRLVSRDDVFAALKLTITQNIPLPHLLLPLRRRAGKAHSTDQLFGRLKFTSG